MTLMSLMDFLQSGDTQKTLNNCLYFNGICANSVRNSSVNSKLIQIYPVSFPCVSFPCGFNYFLKLKVINCIDHILRINDVSIQLTISTCSYLECSIAEVHSDCLRGAVPLHKVWTCPAHCLGVVGSFTLR